jgi:hypothetical protein
MGNKTKFEQVPLKEIFEKQPKDDSKPQNVVSDKPPQKVEPYKTQCLSSYHDLG